MVRRWLIWPLFNYWMLNILFPNWSEMSPTENFYYVSNYLLLIAIFCCISGTQFPPRQVLLEPSSYFGKHVCRPKSWPTVTPKDPAAAPADVLADGSVGSDSLHFCPNRHRLSWTRLQRSDFTWFRCYQFFFLGGGGRRVKLPAFFLRGEIFYCRNHNLDMAWTGIKQIFLSQFHTVSLLYCQNYTPGETWCWYLRKYQFY